MTTRRAISNYYLLDLFTNWTQTRRANNLLPINITETMTRASRPFQRSTNELCYNSKTLRQIQEITEQDTTYKILNFGTLRRVHKLGINRKKYRPIPRKPLILQQGSNFNNLIHIKPQSIRSASSIKSVKIATGNVQSFKNKEHPLLHQLIEQDIDIMVVTETWLTKDDTVWLDSCDFNKDTYRIQSAHHQNGLGGGLALIHRSTSDVKLVARGQTRSFKYATWLPDMKKKNITVTGIYHQPLKNTITNRMFIDDITAMMQAYLKTHSLHLVSLSMSPQAHMSRVTYLISTLQRKHPISNSPPAKPVPFCQITSL